MSTLRDGRPAPQLQVHTRRIRCERFSTALRFSSPGSAAAGAPPGTRCCTPAFRNAGTAAVLPVHHGEAPASPLLCMRTPVLGSAAWPAAWLGGRDIATCTASPQTAGVLQPHRNANATQTVQQHREQTVDRRTGTEALATTPFMAPFKALQGLRHPAEVPSNFDLRQMLPVSAILEQQS